MKTLLEKKPNELHQEDAMALAQQVERYEKALKLMKDKLKAYVELHGPVTANGKVWDYFQSTSWKFEADRLKAMAGMMAVDGINPFQYLTLPNPSIKSLGWSDETLSHYGTKEPGSKSFRSVLAENYSKK